MKNKEQTKKTRKIFILTEELASMYAMRTLYDYFSERIKDIEFIISKDQIQSEREKIVADGIPIGKLTKSIDCIVSAYSDISTPKPYYNNLCIDIAILKNSVTPLTEKEKEEIREKYKIKTDKPVVVVGFVSPSETTKNVIKKIYKFCNLYLVGNISHGLILSPKRLNSHINLIREHGVLKDYYAIADLTLTECNLIKNNARLHNFVEATENSLYFLVEPEDKRQYGYKELVDAGCIIEYKNTKELIDGILHYLKNYNGEKPFLSAREKHLQTTREKYFPIIEYFLRNSFDKPFHKIQKKTDLIIEKYDYGILLKHPVSVWKDPE